MLKPVYALFLGILLAVFVGVGIATYWPAASYPEPPTFMKYGVPQTLTDEQQQQLDAYDQTEKAYRADSSTYNRNISIAVLVIAVIFLVLGLTLSDHLILFADGLLYGGVFSLIYSIIRGFISEDPSYRFLVTVIGLIVVAAVGYWKFFRGREQARHG